MKWVIVVPLALVSTNLFAQPAEPGGYVYGGVSVPWQDGVTTDKHRTYVAAPGGWSTGLFAGGGARLTRRFSIEAEWRRTGIMEAIEPSRGFTYSLQRRDSMIGAGGRFRLAVSEHLTLEPLALIEFVREQSWLAARRDVLPLPPTGNLEDHAPYVDSWGRGLVTGFDLRAGRRDFALAPGVRVHRFWRDAEGDISSTWPGGVSRWGVEITVGIRADF